MANNTAKATGALATLTRGGTSYTMTRLAQTAVSASPWTVDSTVTTAQTVTGILSDFKASQRDGVVIQMADRRYLIAASGLTFTPDAGDRFTDSSKDFEVISVETVRAGDVDVIHYIQVRA